MTILSDLGLTAVDDFQQSLFWPALRAMTLGVRIDLDRRREFARDLKAAAAERAEFITAVLGHPLNPRSTTQMRALFYHDLGMKEIRSKTSGAATLNNDALLTIAKREPLLRPLVNAILDERTLGTLKSTFVDMELSSDGRARSSFNITGTTEYRLSSDTDAFGSGGNLQNIPSDKSKVNAKAKEREKNGGTPMGLPNVRRMYVPDPGYTFFDLDLDRADLQVVVWEADDSELKSALREGADLHMENAKALFGPNATRLHREWAKTFCHGTNYGSSARTMASQIGVTVAQAEAMRRRWFEAHPGILRWHADVKAQLEHNNATVSNRFGYQRHFFERPGSVLPEALAWIPASTVACAMNRAWVRIYNERPDVQVLLQVHDSLAGQYPSHLTDTPTDLVRLAAIPIPYDDPLTIPVSIKTSTESWGDCAERTA